MSPMTTNVAEAVAMTLSLAGEGLLGPPLRRQLLARLDGTGAPTPVVLLALTSVRAGLSHRFATVEDHARP